MKSVEEIRGIEEKYKKLLFERLKGDARLSLSCPSFQYPEPLFFYIKSDKTEKTIAVRIDGEDGTLRFWDYVDDDYENVDGVWGKMTESGFENFIKKLYLVMDSAVDIEFYDSHGITDDYFAGVIKGGLDEAKARALLKKHGAGINFTVARISNFYGDIQFIYDNKLRSIKR